MSKIKGIALWLLKWTLLMAVIALIILGFSFLERGQLAKEISYALNLPTQEWWQPEFQETPSPQVVEIQDEWKEINLPPNQSLPELKEPNKRLKIRATQVIGIVEAKEVRLYENATAGSVIANETAAIYGGSVKQNVQGARIILAPDEQSEFNLYSHPYQAFKDDREQKGDRGTVYGNLTGNEILALDGTTVLGDVGTVESQLDLAGIVQGNVTGKQIILRSTALIHGDVVISSDSVIMEPGASILGKIRNLDDKPVKIVKGETSSERSYHNNPSGAADFGPSYERVVVQEDSKGFLFLLWIPVLLGILATQFITYGFFPGDVAEGMENLTLRPLRTLWIGFVTAALGVPLCFLLFITILGIPFSLALSIALLLAILVGSSGVCLKIGRKVSASFGLNLSQVKEMLLGVLLVAHLIWIPVLGWLFLMVLGVMGLGSVIMIWYPRFKNHWSRWRESRRTKEAEHKLEEPSPIEESDDENKRE